MLSSVELEKCFMTVRPEYDSDLERCLPIFMPLPAAVGHRAFHHDVMSVCVYVTRLVFVTRV